MFVAVGLFGIGGPLVSIGAPKAIAQWFQGAERGFAIGVYITGPLPRAHTRAGADQQRHDAADGRQLARGPC